MLKQTLDATYDPGVLLLYGPNVKFTSTEQMFSKLIGKSSVGIFTIEVMLEKEGSIKQVFRKRQKKGLELVEFTYTNGSNNLSLNQDMTTEAIEAILPEYLKELEKSLAKHGRAALNWSVERNRCFLTVGLNASRLPTGIKTSLAFPSVEEFASHIRRIIHVPGLRGNPERTYKTTAIGTEFPGTFETYVASVIHHWQTIKSEKLRELGSSLEALGLTWKVEARQIDDTQVELRVGRLPHGVKSGARDTVNITDVGFGVSQTLPVLVALLLAERGQLVYIEQPEIHLHPRAQGAMAQILADAALRGVKVVVETHSSLLLRGIQTVISKGVLPKELVKLHWFTRKLEDGTTEIASTDLDENGAFGEWPVDFDEVILDSEKQYLDSVELKGFFS